MDHESQERLTSGGIAAGFNPADYFTFVLDQEIRDAGMPGGYCGFAVELAAIPDLAQLQRRMDLLAERFPQCTAAIEKRGKRYFWAVTGHRLELQLHPCPAAEPIDDFGRRAALEILNQAASSVSTMPLSVHWLGDPRRGVLLLRWMHPLLDARGVKLVLDFLAGRLVPDGQQNSPPPIQQKLAEWSIWKKIGYVVKAKLHNDRCNSLDSCLPTRTESGRQSLRLRARNYNAEETARILKLALRHGGLAGKSLYCIAGLMRAMDQAGPPALKQGYCIPYAFNLRRPNAPAPVFGNQVSCLFAQASREQVADRAGLLTHLLSQYRETVREELDFAYLPLMWLGQWLSPKRYATLLRKQRSGGELSSCWFSDIGDIRWDDPGFLGAASTGMFHLTWMTLPPGLALLVGQLNGRLTLSYNYLYPAVDETWLAEVMNLMDAELLGVAEA